MNFEEIAYNGWIMAAVILLALWSSIWKAIALWRAGRNNHLAWFLFIFIFNTAGILEIIYIFAFSKNITIEQN